MPRNIHANHSKKRHADNIGAKGHPTAINSHRHRKLLFVAAALVTCGYLYHWMVVLGGSATVCQEFPTTKPADGETPPPDPKQTSQYATVMGMATGYDVNGYKRFVGSLRATGYLGHIILIIDAEPQFGVEKYLASQNVIMKPLVKVECSHNATGVKPAQNEHDKERVTCAHPYPHLKLRWGRFALLRDYLEECTTCTGPALVADVRDTFFQRDPFGPEAPPVVGLQLFEEPKVHRTTHWLVRQPVEDCKQTPLEFDEIMLCSGTTIGTREAMLQYLHEMVVEMTEWMKHPQCCCNRISGDDQSIHNYIHYALHKLPFATAVPNRMGLVFTVGTVGAKIHEAKKERFQRAPYNMTIRQSLEAPYSRPEQHAAGEWLPDEYDLTDKEGYFLNWDWSRSFIIHQYDRFGQQLDEWMFQHGPCKGLL